ncbi:hypothetical protein CR203_19170 [Salipaludibacillus neizhouensis]|uniref:DUF4260 domain-containing protein n=1 Tax=Salipaludibacillus neizhouensis TaxID=885475 RepID=A0A3A9K3C9_9BACI|nr:DUF4260 domain-containing protein [Salipaludibacillus neizhouensis]RKL65768.1 hypothetical protein CR203_19170 [Salipaludibacillus neizhouensis]
MNKLILHIEGITVLLVSVFIYSQLDAAWWMFFAFLLAPDFSMLGYMINNSVGAVTYNIFHSYILPLFLSVVSIFIVNDLLLAFSMIWISHIGMDRFIGYGLKYTSKFKDTHLQRV